MDTVFFVLSKMLWFFIEPGNVVFFLLIVGVVLIWTRWKRAGRWMLSLSAALGLFAMLVPVGDYASRFLENRFPAHPTLPVKVDGIVVLGGAIDPIVTVARGEAAAGGSIERIISFAQLSKAFPEAKLVYTGGSGLVLSQEIKEADVVAPLLDMLGIDPTRVMYESDSRNTYENAIHSKVMVMPSADETWILVTSAAHMPRAMGSFRAARWPDMIAYPADFTYQGNEILKPPLSMLGGLGRMGGAVHELLGLAFYYLTGKSDALIPGP